MLTRLPERSDRDAPLVEDVTPDGKRFPLNVPVEPRSSDGFHVVVGRRALVAARGA